MAVRQVNNEPTCDEVAGHGWYWEISSLRIPGTTPTYVERCANCKVYKSEIDGSVRVAKHSHKFVDEPIVSTRAPGSIYRDRRCADCGVSDTRDVGLTKTKDSSAVKDDLHDAQLLVDFLDYLKQCCGMAVPVESAKLVDVYMCTRGIMEELSK